MTDSQEIEIVCKAKAHAPNDNGGAVGLTIGVDANPQLTREQLLDTLVEGRHKITMTPVAEDGKTPKMFTQAFSGTGDFHAASVKRKSGIWTISGRLSFKCDDDEKKHLVDFHNQHVRIVMLREGTAGEDPAGKAEVGGDKQPTLDQAA